MSWRDKDDRSTWTTGEIARLIQVTPQTIINWLEKGYMPYSRPNHFFSGATGPRMVLGVDVKKYVIKARLPDEVLHPAMLERFKAIKG